MTPPQELSAATLGLHGGTDERITGAPFVAGPVFASAFHLPGDQAGVKYQYGRFDNPTWAALEEVIGRLEGGPALTFASGVAATAAVLTPFVRPGDTIVLPDDGYFATRSYAQTYLARWGIQVRLLPTPQMESADFAGVKLVFVETPSNPSLDVVDIEALAARVHAAGALLAVDNTTATVLSQVPLALGADFSVASDTKAFNGHSDVVFGHVAVRDAELLAGVRQWRTLVGAIPGPMEAWLVHRGLATLDLRLARQTENALAVAELLARHRAVSLVRYPGLESDPSHAGGAAADALLRRRGRLRARRRRHRAALSRRLLAAVRGHQLRRRAQLGRAARALGHRQGRRRLHPPERRRRGHRRRRRRHRRSARPALGLSTGLRTAMDLGRVFTRRRLVRAGIVVAVLVLLWSSLALIVPATFKSRVEGAALETLGRRLTIGDVAFNPWKLALRVDDIALAGASEAAPPQLEIRQLRGAVSMGWVFRFAPVIDRLEVESPMLRLTRLDDGRYDIDDVLQRLAARPAAPDDEGPPRAALLQHRRP